MASCPPLSCRKIVSHHSHNPAPPPIYSYAAATTNWSTSFISPYSYSCECELNRRNSVLPKRNSRSGGCRAAGPQLEPPPEKHLSPISGATTAFAKFQETLQIFFAVLFWMSLFFWSSIWDGGNDGNKPPRFRK